MSELDDLKVYGETAVGWCAATPPNEFVDKDGAPFVEPHPNVQPDPRAPPRRALTTQASRRFAPGLRRSTASAVSRSWPRTR